MTNWIKKLIVKFRFKIEQLTPSFSSKIIKVTGTQENKDVKIHYQVCGKSTVVETTPKDLFDNLAQIQGFSKEDSRLIIHFYMGENKEPNLKIRHINFDSNTEGLEIEDLRNGYVFTLTIEQLFESESLIRDFSTKDLLILYSILVNFLQRRETLQIKPLTLNQNQIPYVINN